VSRTSHLSEPLRANLAGSLCRRPPRAAALSKDRRRWRGAVREERSVRTAHNVNAYQLDAAACEAVERARAQSAGKHLNPRYDCPQLDVSVPPIAKSARQVIWVESAHTQKTLMPGTRPTSPFELSKRSAEGAVATFAPWLIRCPPASLPPPRTINRPSPAILGRGEAPMPADAGEVEKQKKKMPTMNRIAKLLTVGRIWRANFIIDQRTANATRFGCWYRNRRRMHMAECHC